MTSEGQIVNNSMILNNSTTNTVSMIQNLMGGKATLTTINGQQVLIRATAPNGSYIYLRSN